MMPNEPIRHGGDLATARALFPQAPTPWIDLSTGINPFAYPLPHLPPDVWQRLPGREAEAALLAAARRRYAVADGKSIMAAPGTQILIDLLPGIWNAATVSILGPTYSEHARAWQRSGAQIREVSGVAELEGAMNVVVVNPNNPDGRIVAPSVLSGLAGDVTKRGGLVVVDESFADFDPQISIIPRLEGRVVVLRSFGKTYGLAGLRLGFAIGPEDIIDTLRTALGPWAVSGPALAIGAVALSDDVWLADQRAARVRDAGRLDALLAPFGAVVGGTLLYRLLETPAADRLFHMLGQTGIYVRRFDDQPTRLRFGLPPDEPAWARLEAALAACLAKA